MKVKPKASKNQNCSENREPCKQESREVLKEGEQIINFKIETVREIDIKINVADEDLNMPMEENKQMKNNMQNMCCDR